MGKKIDVKPAGRTVPFSVKLKPEDKAELEAHLKHIATLKGCSMGDAMKLSFDILKTYGELPKIIHDGFLEFTTETSRKLDDIHRVMMMVGNSEAALNAVSEADQLAIGYESELIFEELPVSSDDFDREPQITRMGSRHWKPPFKNRKV